MGRIYRVYFEDVSVSGGTNDLLQLTGAAGKIVKVRETWWGSTDTTLPAAQMTKTRSRFLPAPTNGSGGSTPTIHKMDAGDAAASFTALANNTVKATSTGTIITTDESGDHIYNGYRKAFRAGSEPVIGPTEAWVLELLSTFSPAVHLSGGVEVEEIGG